MVLVLAEEVITTMVQQIKAVKTNTHELYCPRCGHFVMKENILNGCIEVKCKHCKALIKLTMDEETAIIALSMLKCK